MTKIMGAFRNKLVVCIAMVGCCYAGSPWNPTRENVFEESSPGVWRALSGPGFTILRDGFLFTHGRHLSRFRWDASMKLASIRAEEIVASHNYRLRPGVEAPPLTHARRVRASSRDGKVSVVYYFGPRGMEFDIEVAPRTKLPVIELAALDTGLRTGAHGRAKLGDADLLLAPVAFSEDKRGRKHSVAASYALEGNSRLRFAVGPYNSRETLTIDPAVTYATYFDSSGNDEPLAIREMPDGSVFIAYSSSGAGLPQGISLDTVKEEPYSGCAIANLIPATNHINFVSYLDGTCSSVDIDSSGRILLVGVTEAKSGLGTPDAQYPFPPSLSPADYFLARVSADGKTLEYATFLNMGYNSSAGPIFVRAGAGDAAFLALDDYGLNLPEISGGYQGQPVDSTLVVLGYDLSAHQYDGKTFLQGAGNLYGLDVSPTGAIYIFGSTGLTDLTLQSPIQTAPPTQEGYACFVAAFSPDLSSLLFSTYLGGQGSYCGINSIVFEQNGSLLLAGIAGNQSIPGLKPARPFQQVPVPYTGSPFSVEGTPGSTTLNKGFLAGGYLENVPAQSSTSSLTLKDGRYCLLLSGYPIGAPAGGAGFPYPGPTLGCLNDEASDFALVTPVASGSVSVTTAFVTPSQKGGVWSLQSTLNSNEVSNDLIATSLQPVPPVSGTNYVVLRYVDLGVASPQMVSPVPLELPAGSLTAAEYIFGRNFVTGMYLDLDDQTVPLVAFDATAATIDTTQTVTLTAGQYTAHLVIPATPAIPNALMSDPFSVTVSNLPPNFLPFSQTSDPTIFTVLPPAYPTSQATWRGQSLPLLPGPRSGYYQVQLPAGTATGPGDLVLTNPRPGGGVQRQTIQFAGPNAAVPAISRAQPSPLTDLPADFYQFDGQRMILYTARSILNGGFEIDTYDLGAQLQLASVSLPKAGASSIWDFELSPDGTLLYIVDNQFRIRRIQTDSLAVDLTFTVPSDVPGTLLDNLTLNVMPLADMAESLVITTPAGRMFLYDRGQPRAYSTDDFPPAEMQSMEPVLATSNYVYAVAVAKPSLNSSAVPSLYCLVRYAIDELGFSPPEEFCNLALEWGKYAEMKTYDGMMVLEAFNTARALSVAPGGVALKDSLSIDPSQNLTAAAPSEILPINGQPMGTEIVLARLDTGEPIGHAPSNGVFLNTGITHITVVGNLLLFLASPRASSSVVGIIYDWPDNIETYP
jgi:hypothetical protein